MESGQFKRALVFFLTYLSYALYHASRKNLSGVKASVSNDWRGNDTTNPHTPFFTSEKQTKNFLGTLDGLFMIFYAAGLFFWGWVGDRWNPKHVVVLGMIGSAITLVLFGSLPYWLDFYSIFLYISVYCAFGVFQGCGWPNEVAIMANWFPKENRGTILGAWTSCQPIGNIFGSLLISAVISLGYQWTFVFNSGLIFIGGVLLHVCVSTKPKNPPNSEDIVDNVMNLENKESEAPLSEESEKTDRKAVSFWQALLLPNVLAYCLCNACLMMVNYAFFFWLPFYLTHRFSWSEATANELTTWYDLGGAIGSVVGGMISDRLGYRTPIIMIMLIGSLFSLFIYSSIGAHMVINILMITVLGMTISGPYNLIAGTISVDLGSQPTLAGNEKAISIVSGLIDGSGSLGSAIGQFFVPVIQNAFGWHYVFYMLIVINFLATLCLLRRLYLDFVDIWKKYRRHGSPSTHL